MQVKHRGTPLPHLAYWRILQGKTQRELADVAGITSKSIALLETARNYAKPATITKLAAALGITTKELIEGEAIKKRKQKEAAL